MMLMIHVPFLLTVRVKCNYSVRTESYCSTAVLFVNVLEPYSTVV